MGHEKTSFPFLQSGSAEWRFPAWSTLPMDRPCDFPTFLSRTLSDSTSLHFHCMPRQPVDRNEHVIFRLSRRKKKVKNPEKLKTALTYTPLCPIPAVGLKYVKCLGGLLRENDGERKMIISAMPTLPVGNSPQQHPTLLTRLDSVRVFFKVLVFSRVQA